MLVLGLFSRDPHATDLVVSDYLSWGWGLALVFVFDVGVESRIAEVLFATYADEVPLHGVVSGSPFSSGHELVLLEHSNIYKVDMNNVRDKCAINMMKKLGLYFYR